jgi:dTDP-4-dehydrorhamnose reductase
MKVLVTGSAGQVGHCIVGQLAKTSWQVLALDRSSLDITDYSEVVACVNRFEPDVVINAAAYTAVDKAESKSELAYAINSDGSKNLALAAEAIGAVLLHISTDYVFSGDKTLGGGDSEYTEYDDTSPQGVYGASKLAGEEAVKEHCSRYIILRTAWVFGEQGNNFVKTMLRLAQTRDELGVVSDQYGGPTYAGDIAKTLLTISAQIDEGKAVEWGVYHYSGYPYVSWHSFAESIFSIAVEKKCLRQSPVVNAITTANYPTPAKRPKNSTLSHQKIARTLGIEPSNWLAALTNIKDYI